MIFSKNARISSVLPTANRNDRKNDVDVVFLFLIVLIVCGRNATDVKNVHDSANARSPAEGIFPTLNVPIIPRQATRIDARMKTRSPILIANSFLLKFDLAYSPLYGWFLNV